MELLWLLCYSLAAAAAHGWLKAGHKRTQEEVDKRVLSNSPRCGCDAAYRCYSHQVQSGRYFIMAWAGLVLFPPATLLLFVSDVIAKLVYEAETRRIERRNEAAKLDAEIQKLIKENNL